jgi:tetratricopeptide (TPR) repeat protein
MAESSPAAARASSRTWLARFGRELRIARGRAGLTQRQLAHTDLTKSFISLLESGRSYPSVETTTALARRLRTAVATLLLDPADLRLEAALMLLHLAWATDPATRGADAVHLAATAELLLPDLPADLRVRAVLVRARVAMAGSQMDEATRWTDRAAAIARRHHLQGALGLALTLSGIVEERRGAFQTAVPVLEDAIEVMRKAKTLRSEEGIWALLSLGAARARTGNIRRAHRAYRRALELASRLQFSRLCGRALLGLGMLEWARRRLDLAVEFLSRAHEVFERLEDLAEVSPVLTNLGRIRFEQGLHGEALAVLQKSLRLKERLGDIRGRSAVLDEIARVLLTMGRLSDAMRAARRAVSDARTAQDQSREAVAQVTLGRVLRARNRRREAAETLRVAARALTRLGMHQEAAIALAELESLSGEVGQAREAVRKRALARAQPAPVMSPASGTTPSP